MSTIPVSMRMSSEQSCLGDGMSLRFTDVYAKLADKTQAMAWLEKAYGEHGDNLVGAKGASGSTSCERTRGSESSCGEAQGLRPESPKVNSARPGIAYRLRTPVW